MEKVDTGVILAFVWFAIVGVAFLYSIYELFTNLRKNDK